MLASFLKITLRTLYREKIYALINIAGLSIAIACCIILGLWLRSELTYDHHNVNYKRIFRIVDSKAVGNTPDVEATLGPFLAENYSEIREFVRFADYDSKGILIPEIRHGDDVFRWGNLRFADSTVFSVFTHDIIFGDPETALVDPASMAVSESFSRKYFGAGNPLGETMTFNDKNYKITLVFADLPENTSLKYDVLVPYQEKEQIDAQAPKENIIIISMCETYLLMQEGYRAQDFKPISDATYEKFGPSMFRSSDDKEYFYFLQSLADIHLNSDIPGENKGNKFHIYGFAVVAVFILLVACINYMNLATARAAKRAREVGIRKIVGAGKGMLGLQFLGEAICFSVIALLFAIVLLEIALSLTPIDSLLNKHLELTFMKEPGLLLWMLGFSLVIGLVSGAYPALYLSAMPVLSALTVHRAGKRTIRFRQVLVMIQFTITVCVIACTLLMALQMQYVSRKPLGFEKENRIIFPLFGRDLASKIPTLKKELLKNSHILEITSTSNKFGQGADKVTLSGNLGGKIIDELAISVMYVDDNFFGVMGMEMASGREFSKKLKTDIGGSIIVNETMVKKMEWDEPLGQHFIFGKVIGVVKNFHFDSLHSPVEHLVITPFKDMLFESPIRYLILHISEENRSETLAFLEKKFEEFDPEHEFQYEFMDDILDAHYLSEKRLIKLIGSFGGICIFVSCLGLFGLSAFTTEQRTKEIGIRKVLGASTLRIICMLFRDIVFLVLGGAVIASLVSYFVMDEWLSSFAYRTGINPLVFFMSAVLAASVAFVTVAMQSYKTAQENPVKALRYE